MRTNLTTVQEAFHFLEQLKCSDVYTPEARKINLKCTQELLLRGETYKKICEVLVERYGYAYVHKLIDKTVEEVSQVREIMAKLRGEFFGSEPKSKRQKLNEILDRLTTYNGLGKMQEIINMLIELRDEEESI